MASLTEAEEHERRLRAFVELPREQQAQAIRRLAAAGHADDTIANATALSTEMVRRIIAEGSSN